jgi:hypothetical protein
MNAGDEMALRFPAPPAPPAGWTRDYVLVGDGWVKDGDLNTTFGKTVLPLPYHGRQDYTIPPRGLENDPVYRRFPEDWQTYHTRYVTPQSVLAALRGGVPAMPSVPSAAALSRSSAQSNTDLVRPAPARVPIAPSGPRTTPSSISSTSRSEPK